VENGVRAEPEIDGMATLDGSVLRVLIWNYHDDLLPAAPAPVQLAIQMPAELGSRVRVSHLRVDQSHGDAYSAWVARGMPERPSAADIAALQQAMVPSLLAPDQTVEVVDGNVVIDFALPRFGVSLLTIVTDR
jgi:xylan 1,4-beta-xylosidase